MTIEKCKYFNDHQTACCLMIDDLVPVAVSKDGKIGPGNDWGYLKDGKDSQYNFLDEKLFSRYPEIRGTIFMPLAVHKHMEGNKDYQVTATDFDDDFIRFLNKISSRFEFAFHGIRHTWKDDKTGTTVFEFADPSNEDIVAAIAEVKEFEQKTGITFYGGKFPGYRYNRVAQNLLQELNAEWWALDADMINSSGTKNSILADAASGIVYIPTNVSGDIFIDNQEQSAIRIIAKRIIKNKYYQKPGEYLLYLYKNGYPITIQEHYQNQGTSAKRQKPNLYDDISSLDKIYRLLSSWDIWHSTCTEIAGYHDAYINCEIVKKNNEEFSVTYSGKSAIPGLTIRTDAENLLRKENQTIIKGNRKNSNWIFNNIRPGTYIRK